MRLSPHAYDQYAREVVKSAQQVFEEDLVSLEESNPAQLNYCADPESLKSLIHFGFNSTITSYDDLSKYELWAYLAKKSE